MLIKISTNLRKEHEMVQTPGTKLIIYSDLQVLETWGKPASGFAHGQLPSCH